MNISDIQKTIRYMKRNGVKDTYLAARERLEEKIRTKRKGRYVYTEPTPAELVKQQEATKAMVNPPLVSILVPLYNTKSVFLEDLILSVMDQSYQHFELILGDASDDDHLKGLVEEFSEQYGKIRYIRLEENGGISENTNAILREAKGDYIALLDHDDVLTTDALYQMVVALQKKMESLGVEEYSKGPALVYSDEDKCNTYLDSYFAPNLKPAYNLDLLLTNNYICHLSMFRRDILQALELRKEYDGAQDFDLILRTVLVTEQQVGEDKVKDYILHVPKVLYHWRSSEGSTAENTDAKGYAYEAGGRAIESFLLVKGWKATVVAKKHLGFYQVEYDNLFESRPKVGVIVRPAYAKGKLCMGAINTSGKTVYGGLRKGYSGYLHRASLQQRIGCGDIRCMELREDLIPLFEKITGTSYPLSEEEMAYTGKPEKEEVFIKKSIKFCNKLREMGVEIIYDPSEKVETNEAES
ncbi:MAG: glycosyltransferase [Lachnospiraceae bacterium]|nr:glycosyltransferase [Lachnospiraceae bacterium]